MYCRIKKCLYLCSVELQQQGFKFNNQTIFDYEKADFIQ